MKNTHRIVILILIITLLATLVTVPIFADESDNYIAAHWKFQNEEGCYTGSIEDDSLRFIDLTGNGNDLEVCYEGNGNELDIFEWDEGASVGEDGGYTSASSLRFGNTWEKALSVDPYPSEQTEYSGAYVSGKYFQTVDGAPLNSVDSTTGWTVEIIFKIDEEWNNNYNRYTGLFSRQGVVESQDEPAFSMAVSELISGGTQDGYIGTEGTTGLQYVHVDVDENKTNYELMNGEIYAEQWIHFMVTSDGYFTEVYINGENVFASGENNEIYITDALFSWEVGVGRKLGTDKATMNPQHPEGLIRRLFCGSIAEIRFTMNYMWIEDSLLYQNLIGEETMESSVPETEAPTTSLFDETTLPEDPEESTAIPEENDITESSMLTDNVQGGCGSIISGVGVLSILGLTVLLLRKKAVLPFPMLFASDKKYITSTHDTTEMGVIMATSTDLAFISTVVEVLNRESARTVLPKYYSESLKLQLMDDEKSAEMLDIVHDNFDNAFILAYNQALGGNILQAFSTAAEQKREFSAVYAGKQKSVQRNLEKMIALFKKNNEID